MLPIEPVEVATLIATLLEAIQPRRYQARLVPQHVALLQHGVVMHLGSMCGRGSCRTWSVCSCANLLLLPRSWGRGSKSRISSMSFFTGRSFAVEKSASTSTLQPQVGPCAAMAWPAAALASEIFLNAFEVPYIRGGMCDRGLGFHS